MEGSLTESISVLWSAIKVLEFGRMGPPERTRVKARNTFHGPVFQNIISSMTLFLRKISFFMVLYYFFPQIYLEANSLPSKAHSGLLCFIISQFLKSSFNFMSTWIKRHLFLIIWRFTWIYLFWDVGVFGIRGSWCSPGRHCSNRLCRN